MRRAAWRRRLDELAGRAAGEPGEADGGAGRGRDGAMADGRAKDEAMAGGRAKDEARGLAVGPAAGRQARPPAGVVGGRGPLRRLREGAGIAAAALVFGLLEAAEA